MTPEDVRPLLDAQRADAMARLAGLRESKSDLVDAARDSNVDDEHDPEGATIAFERAQVDALAGDVARRLAEIDAAERRLADGTYGICVVGGEPIPEERLAARPTATTCIAHS